MFNFMYPRLQTHSKEKVYFLIIRFPGVSLYSLTNLNMNESATELPGDFESRNPGFVNYSIHYAIGPSNPTVRLGRYFGIGTFLIK